MRVQPSAFVVSITPFADDGSFDEGRVRAHLGRLREAGIGAYLGGGGSGEGYVLDAEETTRLLRIGVEELQGTVPVRAMGVEPRTAEEMIRFVGLARATGVDATQIYSLDQGHGHRPSTVEMRRYFEEVLASTDLPAVLSTHQSVGYRVPVDMLIDLAGRYEHLIGVNFSHQDMAYLADVIDAVGDRLEIHVGGPHHALTAWALGATGFLTSEANLIPKTCSQMVTAYAHGDAATLFRSFGSVFRLSTALYGAGGIRATKAVLGEFGHPGGPPRPPQLPADPGAVARLVAQVESLDLADRLERAEFLGGKVRA
ncbi:MAG TPA: dihydrodipicolinate synthase family protein [Acidimicrobiales bacterium]|nr:dihydrodipicolinate synthase family protein [Acidimicrobiales bacterium]